MAIDFPPNPSPGTTYGFNSITWSWNGTAWDRQSTGGAVGATGSDGVQGATGSVGFRYYYNETGLSGSGNPSGNLWFKDGTNSIYINRTSVDGIDAWGHFYSWKLLAGFGVDNGMLMIRRYGQQTPMRMVSFNAIGFTGTVSGLANANNAEYQYNTVNGVVTAGTFTDGETLDVYIMALQGPQGEEGLAFTEPTSQNFGTYTVVFE